MGVTVEFRVADKSDSDFVNARLRAADIREIEALGANPVGMVWKCVKASDFAWTGFVDGVPVMVFGCGQSLLASEGDVWALGTDELEKHPREVLLYGKERIAKMLEIFPCLGNHCGAWHAKNLRWLKKLGFTISAPVPYGAKGEMFCKITIRKETE